MDQLAVVLGRFNNLNPRASLSDLMGVLMYRGHSFAGLEWSDRFLPDLMDPAVAGDDEQAFLGARTYTHSFYSGFDHYGPSLTLRDAMQEKKLNCVRALRHDRLPLPQQRSAGFGHVRWCSGTMAHSVAALTVERDGKPRTILADGLTEDSAEIWPDAYFQGHTWPAGLQNNPSPYAAELYAHSLDNYIWAEGYIVCGEDAGTLVKAAVPYLPYEDKASCEKVFSGPYPATYSP